ncbi:c-type cytochrome, methanol metabolism-related [Paracoccus aestuariivivens]|uniref:C-type cytochrome, methanol metabolism-related n=1 Tax=Paracoccus aestuariivivens TaxID=1820333 RepID=A0A6L6JAT7_9RHOB|nr:c-type cytochrome, methanol metabolism-related [Paracoccus aestuariivivens]MTH78305.1 c-type cytochrome, methanol metabolism-related [Paracoccus aestuariivivens]
MINRTTARLMAICVACVATTAMAQTAVAQDNTTPPAQAGAGAAAATSGNAPVAAPAGDAPVVKAEGGKLVLPNGQDMTPDHMENGRWYNSEGIPTFKTAEDGTIDYATFSGYRRYSAECHVCHGPDGEGSTYAPALKNSVLTMDYYQFQEIVASGKQEVSKANNLVMPAFGTNKNVWCYIDDIYVYLLARGAGDLPRGRPAKKEAKSDDFTTQENSCMEG